MMFVLCNYCKGRIKKGNVVYKSDVFGIVCSKCRKRYPYLADARKEVLLPDRYLDSKRIDTVMKSLLELSFKELCALSAEVNRELYIRENEKEEER